MYSLQVERDATKEKGPGKLYLFFGDKLADGLEAGWDVITGGSVLDPHQYGGLTPSGIEFTLLSEIEYQKHPRGHSMTMCIIYPDKDEDRKEYYNRTFAYAPGSVPFMIHVAGKSTGCVAIRPRHWETAKEEINKAFRHNQQSGEKLKLVVFEEE